MDRPRRLQPPRPAPAFPRCEQCGHTWHGVACVAPRFIPKHTRCEPCACPGLAVARAG